MSQPVTDAAEMTRRAFLDDIRATPGDDGVRLIYADWLEDNGEAERGEFIRLQCEIAKLRPQIILAADRDLAVGPDLVSGFVAVVADGCTPGVLVDWEARTAGGGAWSGTGRILSVEDAGGRMLAQILPFVNASTGGSGKRNDLREREARLCPGDRLYPPGAKDDYDYVTVAFRRGFVAEVRCDLAGWHEHGRALCREHPIEAVAVTDAKPLGPRGGPFAWHNPRTALSDATPDALPAWLWPRLEEVTIARNRKRGVTSVRPLFRVLSETEAEARSLLSDALLLYARAAESDEAVPCAKRRKNGCTGVSPAWTPPPATRGGGSSLTPRRTACCPRSPNPTICPCATARSGSGCNRPNCGPCTQRRSGGAGSACGVTSPGNCGCCGS